MFVVIKYMKRKESLSHPIRLLAHNVGRQRFSRQAEIHRTNAFRMSHGSVSSQQMASAAGDMLRNRFDGEEQVRLLEDMV